MKTLSGAGENGAFDRVVLIDKGGREVSRGFIPLFDDGEKEEVSHQGRVYAIAGESMGAKLFKEVPPTVIVPPPPVAQETIDPDKLLNEAAGKDEEKTPTSP